MQTENIRLEDHERTRCEVWTRVMGYHRPVSEFNPGKQAEHAERCHFAEPAGLRAPATAAERAPSASAISPASSTSSSTSSSASAAGAAGSAFDHAALAV